MTDALMYMPIVECAKCGKPALMQRVHHPNTNRRYVRAVCHGRVEEMDFVADPLTKVVAFKEQAHG